MARARESSRFIVGKVAVFAPALVVPPWPRAVALGLVLAALTATAAVAEGARDPTFGYGGITQLELPDWARLDDLAVEAGGRIVAVGPVLYPRSGGGVGFYLGAVTPTGAMDASFGTDGFSGVDVDVDPDGRMGLVILPGDRILVAGKLMPGSASGQVFTATFTADGDLTSLATWPAPVSSATPFDLVATPDGRAILGVTGARDGSDGGARQFALARVAADGSLDPTWHASGWRRYDWATAPDPDDQSEARALAVQPDGRVLVTGCLANLPQATGLAAVGRITTAGAFDSDFGSAGRAFFDWTTSAPLADPCGSGVALQSDGKVVVAGDWLVPEDGTRRIGTARFHADGLPDGTYGIPGKGIVYAGYTSYESAESQVVRDLLVRGDEALLLGEAQSSEPPAPARRSSTYGWAQWGLQQLTSRGDAETHLEGTGSILIFFYPGTSLANGGRALAVQRDGKLLLGGKGAESLGGTWLPTMRIIRLLMSMPFGDDFEGASTGLWGTVFPPP